ncbi:hypothetical protein PENSTE_c001G07293 [Penicillium steckii]|uniref:NmrA-like domain-containing protein n=1 Tax=Penicillium steckii TaxID=303698 RepID=A0A1V6U0M8_9EURO|nr:hypothetical protein PENSTE_c001G07293 [Penicillium steckii]
MTETIVLTCPSGKQSTHLIPLLIQTKRFHLRLAAHSAASKDHLESEYPETEVVQVDLTSLPDCERLLAGTTAIHHVGPSFHSREKEMGFNLIDAAVSEIQKPDSVFKHFVFSSVLSTQHRNLMQHDLKSRVEERLFLSPLNFTILQPTNFLAGYPVAHLAEQSMPSFERLWNPDTANSLIALEDLAEASARVLIERERHYFAQYPLCSTLPISDRDVVRTIEKHLGKKIEIVTPSFEKGVQNTLTFLFGARESNDWVQSDLDSPGAEGDLRPDITRDEAERLPMVSNSPDFYHGRQEPVEWGACFQLRDELYTGQTSDTDDATLILPS